MSNEPDDNATRLVIKLKETATAEETAQLWHWLQQAYPGTEVEPTFPQADEQGPSAPAEAPAALFSYHEAPAFEAPTLGRYYTLQMRPAENPFTALADLERRPEVAEAMEEERPSAPPHQATAAAVALRIPQPHLGPAPAGIGAAAAHARPGGRGEGIGFADLESGWNLDHVDLLDLGLHARDPLFGVNCHDREHGTAVLGIVAARGSGSVTGIAPALARVEVGSPLRLSCSGRRELARLIRATAEALSPGDVLLLEAQVSFSGEPEIPAEVVPFLADAIRFAVSRGIVVVEPAGNKQAFLDELNVRRGRTLAIRHPDFRDSGAILVAAATADVPHRRHRDSSFGSRVDCFGWGERVVTCGGRVGNRLTDHTHDFSGTSAAAAMVAGVALCVQGMAKARHGTPFSPGTLRNILRDPNNGTLPEGGPDAMIGVMPDLARIVANVFPD